MAEFGVFDLGFGIRLLDACDSALRRCKIVANLKISGTTSLNPGSQTMIFGMSVATFTLLHVILSLVGLFAGFVVLLGMFASRKLDSWTGLFLATTVLTSVTGFFFPFDHILPSHIVGVISLILLAIAIFAFYARRIVGSWRWTYVATAIAALYLNTFVAVAQAFLKVSALKTLAPTGAEPPFVIAQGIVLVVFIALGVLAIRAFHPRDEDGTALRASLTN
jgi:hypothetical protein